jgi:hypothetical protein
MGHDFDLTKEELERYNRKKFLLKVPVSYMASEDLELPQLEFNFTPEEVKLNKKIVTEVVDIKKEKKNKSNKLL